MYPPPQVQSPEDAILFDLMWADPQDAKGISMAAQVLLTCC